MGVDRGALSAKLEEIHVAEKKGDLKEMEKACREKEYLLASGERLHGERERASMGGSDKKASQDDDRYVIICIMGMATSTFILVL